MLEKLKSMIQSDVEKIEIERHRVKNAEIQKELAEKQEQCKGEYKGRNKFKIMLINCFKYKDADAIGALFFNILFVLGFVTIFLMSIKESDYISLILGSFMLSTMYFLLLWGSSSWNDIAIMPDETKGNKELRLLEKEIEKNNDILKQNKRKIIITKLFSSGEDGYKNYTTSVVSKNVFEESISVLNDDTFKRALVLSGGKAIKYGYLTKAIIEYEEKQKITSFYNKLKNS